MVMGSTTPQSSFITGLLVGSAVTCIASALWLRRSLKRQEDSISYAAVSSSSSSSHRADQSDNTRQRHALPPALRAEQISRSTLYFGESSMHHLSTECRVCIVGVGGVGSHAAMAISRAGLGPLLRLVDFDQVTLSSLNRHACATLEDVGIPKVTCVYNAIRRVCPSEAYLQVEPMVELFSASSADRLLALPHGQSWDMIIDAIDDVPTKAELIQYCLFHRIPVVSCMGAGGKADVTRLHVGDLQSAAKDPLATKLRQTLKKLMKVNDNEDCTSYLQDMDKLSILYSSEKTVVKLAELTPEQQEAPHAFGAMDHMRVRVVPVLGTMPAIMGMSLAALCLTRLGNKPVQPVPGERIGRSVRHRILQHFKTREERIRKEALLQAGMEDPQLNNDDDNTQSPDEDGETSDGQFLGGIWVGRVQIDMDDVDYLFEVWRNRCAVSGARLGTVLSLARWDLGRPSTCDNLVLLSAKALKLLDQPGGRNNIQESVRRRIEMQLANCRCE